MKILLMILTFICAKAYAQNGLFITELTEKPEFLSLKPFVPFAGESDYNYYLENPPTMVDLAFLTSPMVETKKKLLMGGNGRSELKCDGNFTMEKDPAGVQHIVMTSIRVCIDDTGSIVAHNVNENLSDDKIREIQKRLIGTLANPPVVIPESIDDGNYGQKSKEENAIINSSPSAKKE